MTKRKKSARTEADRWFRQGAERFLRKIGVRECMHVADIGCHHGRFTIPMSRIVGSCGIVCAIDRDREVLAKVRKTGKKEHRQNIKVIKVDLAGNTFTSIRRNSIDLALMYDVLHRGYLPETYERRNVLRHVYRIIKPGGILSCFPTHLKKYGLTFERLLNEITDAGFTFKGEARRRIAHDERVVRGRVFRFAKPACSRR